MSCFCKPFGSEPVNESQKLLKFAEKQFYPTFSSFCVKSFKNTSRWVLLLTISEI